MGFDIDTRSTVLNIRFMHRKGFSTRERILRTAEMLFAEHCFQGVSLRALARRANVNVAAINYYFGNMQELQAELFRERLRPLRQAWAEALGEQENQPAQSVTIPKLIDALCLPLFEMHGDRAGGGRHFVKILARSFSDPVALRDPVLKSEYQPALRPFARALRKHVPILSAEDFMWRFSFVIGMLHHTLTVLDQMTELTGGVCKNTNYIFVLQSLAEQCSALFQRKKI